MADGAGYSLTVRSDRAREIAQSLEQGKRYKVEIREYRKKRSLDQNAMYWSILTQVARNLDISNPRCHNLMLRRYGEVERFGDKLAMIVLPDTDEAAQKADEAETYHLKPTNEVRTGKHHVDRPEEEEAQIYTDAYEYVRLAHEGLRTFMQAHVEKHGDGVIDDPV